MKVSEYILTYEKAKRISSLTEILTDSSNLTILSEYRYALDHLVESLDSKKEDNDELVKSYMHLIRASEDAYKMAFVSVYEDINDIDENIIQKSFPAVKSQLIPHLKKMRNRIVHKNSLKVSSSEHLDEILNNLELLMKYKEQLDELSYTKNKIISKYELKQNWSKSILIPILLAIISVLITLIIKFFTQ